MRMRPACNESFANVPFWPLCQAIHNGHHESFGRRSSGAASYSCAGDAWGSIKPAGQPALSVAASDWDGEIDGDQNCTKIKTS